MNKRAKELIYQLQLSPHPEGGYYKETSRSVKMVESPQNREMRSAVTDIYFLLISNQPSRFHRVIHDEIWNYYEGDPLEIIEIQPDTLRLSKTILGNSGGIARYKHCVKGCNWQAEYSIGDYTLVGCTVAPGFDFSDFKFLKEEEGVCSAVLKSNPELVDLI